MGRWFLNGMCGRTMQMLGSVNWDVFQLRKSSLSELTKSFPVLATPLDPLSTHTAVQYLKVFVHIYSYMIAGIYMTTVM